MQRREFLRNSTILGLGSSFLSTFFSACGDEQLTFPQLDTNFDGKIIIVGAGAAGLAAGYMLNQYNIDFEVLEASNRFGGRVGKLEGFADFPIDLGAEWIHGTPSMFSTLVRNQNISNQIETIVYQPQTYNLWDGEKLSQRNFRRHFYSEYKFKNTTWFDFLETYLAPNVSNKILYDHPVTEIDYTGEKVILTANNQTFEADKVLVTVPVAVLQNNLIDFIPSLPQSKIDTLNTIDIPPGMKVFIEFSERFYPDYTEAYDLEGSGSKDFFDAAFRKDSNRNIMCFFLVHDGASAYTNLSDDEVISRLLEELDNMYDGKATETYVKHHVQNWSKEPYILGSYSHFQGRFFQTVDSLLTPLDNKVYFSGEALDRSGSTSTVHGAIDSSYAVVETILTT